MNNRCIGIFDSGVGGLTVTAEILKAMPAESIIYFGDTARVPYGSKPKETVTEYGRQIINFLISKEVKLIIIACGTISSNSYSILAKEYDIPLVELVTPGVAAALESCPEKKGSIGVIGTEATICSGIYERRLLESRPDLTVHSKACPLFVPLAEEGWTDGEVTRLTAEIYLKDLYTSGIGSLLLACTHYPLLSNSIRSVMGDAVLVNPAEYTARYVSKILESGNMAHDPQKKAPHSFYVSGGAEKFDRICSMILGFKCRSETVKLG